MSIIQIPPVGFRVIEEHKILAGIDDSQIRAAHNAWQGRHPSRVEFITDEVVDPICGEQIPGRNEFYGVLAGNGIKLLDWTAKNKADMYCVAVPGGKPFVVVNYNYVAGKGDVIVLEKIVEYESLFKSGIPPKVQLLGNQMLEVIFSQDIKRDVLAKALEYNGYRIFSLPGVNESTSLEPDRSAVAEFCGLGYYSGGWFMPLPEDLDVIKAGTRILVKVRT